MEATSLSWTGSALCSAALQFTPLQSDTSLSLPAANAINFRRLFTRRSLNNLYSDYAPTQVGTVSPQLEVNQHYLVRGIETMVGGHQPYLRQFASRPRLMIPPSETRANYGDREGGNDKG